MPYLGKLLHHSPASHAFVPWKSFVFPDSFSPEGQPWLLTVLVGKLLLCCCKSGRQTIGKAAGELGLPLLMLIAVVSLLAPLPPSACIHLPSFHPLLP